MSLDRASLYSRIRVRPLANKELEKYCHRHKHRYNQVMMQLDLPLKPRPTWGGRRSGAGRKPGPNPRVPHLPRERFHVRFPCHVTVRVRSDVPSLRTVKLVRAFERSLRRVRRRGHFRVVHYSLQSNHAHFVVEANGRAALGRGMKSLGARLARAVNRVFRRVGPVLEDRFYSRVLRTPREVRNAVAYVLGNARKHLARRGGRASLAARPDPASSGRWFDGWRRRPERAHDPPAVALPRTWLLSKGWRRHGLVAIEG